MEHLTKTNKELLAAIIRKEFDNLSDGFTFKYEAQKLINLGIDLGLHELVGEMNRDMYLETSK